MASGEVVFDRVPKKLPSFCLLKKGILRHLSFLALKSFCPIVYRPGPGKVADY
jgi:hypothetical protein